MPWTPALPDVDFGLPLLENLKAVFERDQTEALAWAAAKTPAIASLENFARILKSERVSKSYPSLAIFPVGDAPELGAEAVSLDQHVVFGFEIEVVSRKPEALVEELRKRVAAVRMMVLSASRADIMSGVESATWPMIELGPAQFGQVRESEETAGLYLRSVFLTITIRYLQTGG
jgi:hypothetical protein